MNPNQIYVPNHDKWIKYYETLGTSEHPHYHINPARRSNSSTGGSIGKTGENKIVPIENHSQRQSDKTTEVKVEFVSPAQQVVEQAVSEIRREKGIKRKPTKYNKQSGRNSKRRKTFKFDDVSNQF